MAYLGNKGATGENNSFKILDDLAFTTTFNGSDGNVVNHVADTITINNHRFLTDSRVTYSNVGKLFATRFPKIESEEDGADANTMIESMSVPYPFAGFGVS